MKKTKKRKYINLIPDGHFERILLEFLGGDIERFDRDLAAEKKRRKSHKGDNSIKWGGTDET